MKRRENGPLSFPVTPSDWPRRASLNECHRCIKRDGLSERPDLDFQVEIDVIPDPCAIWRFTGGGLVAAKEGYHYVDSRPGNKTLNRSRRKKVDRNYETIMRNCGVVARGLLIT